MRNRSWHPMASTWLELADKSWYWELRNRDLSDEDILRGLIAVGVDHLGPETGFETEPGDLAVEVFIEQVRQVARRFAMNE